MEQPLTKESTGGGKTGKGRGQGLSCCAHKCQGTVAGRVRTRTQNLLFLLLLPTWALSSLHTRALERAKRCLVGPQGAGHGERSSLSFPALRGCYLCGCTKASEQPLAVIHRIPLQITQCKAARGSLRALRLQIKQAAQPQPGYRTDSRRREECRTRLCCLADSHKMALRTKLCMSQRDI